MKKTYEIECAVPASRIICPNPFTWTLNPFTWIRVKFTYIPRVGDTLVLSSHSLDDYMPVSTGGCRFTSKKFRIGEFYYSDDTGKFQIILE